MGFSREWVQIASKRITNNSCFPQKETEDLLETGLDSLPHLKTTGLHQPNLWANLVRLMKLAKLINLINEMTQLIN